MRARQVRGPPQLHATPVVGEVAVRRYRCTGCGHTTTVRPVGVLPRRLYPAQAIAAALVAIGIHRQSQRAVRASVAPFTRWGEGSRARWETLAAWVTDIRLGRLFWCVRHPPDDWPPWKVAQRAATTLASLAPPGVAPLEAAAAVGAARAG